MLCCPVLGGRMRLIIIKLDCLYIVVRFLHAMPGVLFVFRLHPCCAGCAVHVSLLPMMCWGWLSCFVLTHAVLGVPFMLRYQPCCAGVAFHISSSPMLCWVCCSCFVITHAVLKVLFEGLMQQLQDRMTMMLAWKVMQVPGTSVVTVTHSKYCCDVQTLKYPALHSQCA
jgi:hypothetical protein